MTELRMQRTSQQSAIGVRKPMLCVFEIEAGDRNRRHHDCAQVIGICRRLLDINPSQLVVTDKA
jgi:hypothetical protein